METILITKDKRVASYAQYSGIDRIMVDLEILGKKERQGHLNTVISKHTLNDVTNIRKELTKSKLLVRINPINLNTKNEIEEVLNRGADIIMLPMFKTVSEVKSFVNFVDNRAKVCLLLETPQALVRIDDILEVEGIDEIHIGLNDLHLAMGLSFMFELLSGGIVEYLASKIKKAGIKFGFGGIARLGKEALLNAELILSEHFRLGSSMVILSRDFKGGKENYEELVKEVDFKSEIIKLQKAYEEMKKDNNEVLEKRRVELGNAIKRIV